MQHDPHDLSDEHLASQARAGEREAFEILCDRYLPQVYNRLRARLPPEAVEDVTQEVFMAALTGIKRYRRRSSFRTWIMAIARHKIAGYYRSRERRPEEIALAAADSNPGQGAQGWNERVWVREALAQLPEHYQEILLLRFAEGLPFQQIADVLEISLEAAKSRYRRAVQAMAQALED